MTSSMQGRRVLVVGGSRGLGLGVVQALLAEDAQVADPALARVPVLTVKGGTGVQALSR